MEKEALGLWLKATAKTKNLWPRMPVNQSESAQFIIKTIDSFIRVRVHSRLNLLFAFPDC